MKFDLIIIGAGPSGLSLACSLAKTKLKIAVIEKNSRSKFTKPKKDGRDIALTHRSKNILKKFGIWKFINSKSISPIKEARIFKQEYAKTLLNKKIDASLDGITMMAADLVVRGLPVPSFLFDKAAEYKVMPKEFYKRILNRIKLITTTLDQRNVPKKLTGRYLLEQELMGGTMNDNSTATGDNLIYNYNQHTNQVDAPDWGVPAN